MTGAWLFRLWRMLLGWGTVGLVYSVSDRLQGQGLVMPPGLIDRKITFTPDAVWLYLSFFLVVPLAYMLTPTHRVLWLSRSMSLSAVIAGAVYLMYPTTMIYPLDQGLTLSSRLLVMLTAVDSAQNCLPSLHMTLMTLAVWGVSHLNRTPVTILYTAWVIAIAFSTLQLRRHQIADLVSGALLAMASGWLIYLFRSIKQNWNKRRAL